MSSARNPTESGVRLTRRRARLAKLRRLAKRKRSSGVLPTAWRSAGLGVPPGPPWSPPAGARPMSITAFMALARAQLRLAHADGDGGRTGDVDPATAAAVAALTPTTAALAAVPAISPRPARGH